MNRKELMEWLIDRVPAADREAFVAEIREADTTDERMKIAQKYNLYLTEEEKEAWENTESEISDDELDLAAGGCCSTGGGSRCDGHIS